MPTLLYDPATAKRKRSPAWKQHHRAQGALTSLLSYGNARIWLTPEARRHFLSIVHSARCQESLEYETAKRGGRIVEWTH